ncbi:shikimate dehydrogenase [Thermoactinomyces sp. CICC 10523]|jgi:shikimate dehydrogenase|uniref:shikimate dehydrogenase n=1 Tax=Thermoactinomyces sp. CICC 10523 TaxID=2767428 RepID=UPI0018DCEC7C|nr:shikimate dehydrogenase [Thermoactinomyces sp. CICC 10523]MBH8597341.1 shikimate dehydrogenase [Thermoactinomyces sp. CICC 10523]
MQKQKKAGRIVAMGLIGDPVAHSKSPEMMNAAFEQLGLPYVYQAFRVAPAELEEAVNRLKAQDLIGFNVTIPHKVAIMDLLDDLDQTAAEIGAVNTVVRREGKWIGTNTDGPGYLRSLIEEWNPAFSELSAVILGAGGAARAVGYTLATAGVPKITVANRTLDKAEALAAHLSQWTKTEAVLLADSRAEVEKAQLVVNTTSVGMHPHTEESPVPCDWLRQGQIVSDLVYHPKETLLLRQAKEKGARIHTGLGMLVHQAALALEMWLQKKAPVSLMKEVLEASLTGTKVKKE